MSKYLDMAGLTYFYNQLKNKFATKSDFGTPLIASTAAGMTDTNKVYVYTGSETGYTAGHWYYYDSGSWHDGGTYNSSAVETDKTLSVSDMPADAKVTGDELTDLKSALNYGKTATQGYILTASNEGHGSTWSPVGLPTDEQTGRAVSAWLEDHPEATTTVQDGSIGLIKFADSVNNLLNDTPLKPDLLNLPTVYVNDGDCYGELFFYFSSTQHYKVFDAETLETLYSGVIQGNLKPHANAVSFGLKDESETFPYIYITGYNGKYFDDSSLPPGVCGVYKISDNYELTLIQTINISFVETDLWLGDRSITSPGIIQYGNFVVDRDNVFLYVFLGLADNGAAKTRIFKFDLPDVSSSNVELNSSDVLEYYDVPFYPFLQGAECYDNKLYIGYGSTGSVNETGVAIIDLINHKQIGIIDLSGLLPEVECVFFYRNHLYVNSGDTYKIDRHSPITNIGDLSKLKTTPNNNVVSGINYICDNIGDLSTLKTTPKNNVVSGINYICDNMVYNHKEELTITRTENTYVNVTDFSRIHAYSASGLIIVYIFLKISSSMPTTAKYINIGHINLDGFTPIIPSGYASIVMAPQAGSTDNGNLTLECSNEGVLMISNFSDKPCNTWYKGKLIIL